MLDKQKIKLGIAPIGWTNDDLPELGEEITFEQCISEMALAGFTGTEIGNRYPKEPRVLKQALALRNMQICNCWFSTFFTVGREEETIVAFLEQLDFLQAMGAKVIGCSEQGRGIQGKGQAIFGEQKPVFTKEEWRCLFNGMNKLGKLAAERGMRCCLHHHMGTGIQTPEEIDIFMKGTNENVYLLFDSGHIYFSEGTQEAVDELVKKHINRIAHVHLKDVRKQKRAQVISHEMSFLEAVKSGTFTVPGDGDIVFDNIFKTLEKSKYTGWLLVEAEQDPAKANPLAYAIKAREFIRIKTGL